MKRPLRIEQRENDRGDYWFVLRGGNHQVMTVSEMYPTRDGALRAARRHIELIDRELPLVFSYWAGDRKPRPSADSLSCTMVTERIR